SNEPRDVLFSFEIGRGSGDLKGYLLQPQEGHSLQQWIDLHEKQIIRRALEKADSVRKAAKSLGLSHTALLNKLKKHKIVMEGKQIVWR
ncbi:MAG: hypothetical protein L7F78_22560, partial [Syntrophales bacterium LBB04]|nr:hypothetical protein [Syntrophales bacterium LBB04]